MDNAPIHRAAAVSEVMEEKLIQRAPHPPYSPDLAPSDFYLFGKLKSRLSGTEFRSSDEIIEWIRDEFAKIPRDEWVYCGPLNFLQTDALAPKR